MIHGEENKDELAARQRQRGEAEDDRQRRRKRPVLGKLKTDEEARLAAEIEKLRGTGLRENCTMHCDDRTEATTPGRPLDRVQQAPRGMARPARRPPRGLAREARRAPRTWAHLGDPAFWGLDESSLRGMGMGRMNGGAGPGQSEAAALKAKVASMEETIAKLSERIIVLEKLAVGSDDARLAAEIEKLRGKDE